MASSSSSKRSSRQKINTSRDKCDCCLRTFALTNEFFNINEGNCRLCHRKVCTFCVRKQIGLCRKCNITLNHRQSGNFNEFSDGEINKLLYAYGINIKVSKITGKEFCIHLLNIFSKEQKRFTYNEETVTTTVKSDELQRRKSVGSLENVQSNELSELGVNWNVKLLSQKFKVAHEKDNFVPKPPPTQWHGVPTYKTDETPQSPSILDTTTAEEQTRKVSESYITVESILQNIKKQPNTERQNSQENKQQSMRAEYNQYKQSISVIDQVKIIDHLQQTGDNEQAITVTTKEHAKIIDNVQQSIDLKIEQHEIIDNSKIIDRKISEHNINLPLTIELVEKRHEESKKEDIYSDDSDLGFLKIDLLKPNEEYIHFIDKKHESFSPKDELSPRNFTLPSRKVIEVKKFFDSSSSDEDGEFPNIKIDLKTPTEITNIKDFSQTHKEIITKAPVEATDALSVEIKNKENQLPKEIKVPLTPEIVVSFDDIDLQMGDNVQNYIKDTKIDISKDNKAEKDIKNIPQIENFDISLSVDVNDVEIIQSVDDFNYKNISINEENKIQHEKTDISDVPLSLDIINVENDLQNQPEEINIVISLDENVEKVLENLPKIDPIENLDISLSVDVDTVEKIQSADDFNYENINISINEFEVNKTHDEITKIPDVPLVLDVVNAENHLQNELEELQIEISLDENVENVLENIPKIDPIENIDISLPKVEEIQLSDDFNYDNINISINKTEENKIHIENTKIPEVPTSSIVQNQLEELQIEISLDENVEKVLENTPKIDSVENIDISLSVDVKDVEKNQSADDFIDISVNEFEENIENTKISEVPVSLDVIKAENDLKNQFEELEIEISLDENAEKVIEHHQTVDDFPENQIEEPKLKNEDVLVTEILEVMPTDTKVNILLLENDEIDVNYLPENLHNSLNFEEKQPADFIDSELKEAKTTISVDENIRELLTKEDDESYSSDSSDSGKENRKKKPKTKISANVFTGNFSSSDSEDEVKFQVTPEDVPDVKVEEEEPERPKIKISVDVVEDEDDKHKSSSSSDSSDSENESKRRKPKTVIVVPRFKDSSSDSEDEIKKVKINPVKIQINEQLPAAELDVEHVLDKDLDEISTKLESMSITEVNLHELTDKIEIPKAEIPLDNLITNDDEVLHQSSSDSDEDKYLKTPKVELEVEDLQVNIVTEHSTTDDTDKLELVIPNAAKILDHQSSSDSGDDRYLKTPKVELEHEDLHVNIVTENSTTDNLELVIPTAVEILENQKNENAVPQISTPTAADIFGQVPKDSKGGIIDFSLESEAIVPTAAEILTKKDSFNEFETAEILIIKPELPLLDFLDRTISLEITTIEDKSSNNRVELENEDFVTENPTVADIFGQTPREVEKSRTSMDEFISVPTVADVFEQNNRKLKKKKQREADDSSDSDDDSKKQDHKKVPTAAEIFGQTSHETRKKKASADDSSSTSSDFEEESKMLEKQTLEKENDDKMIVNLTEDDTSQNLQVLITFDDDEDETTKMSEPLISLETDDSEELQKVDNSASSDEDEHPIPKKSSVGSSESEHETEQLMKFADKSSSEDSEEENKTVEQQKHQKTISSSDSEDETNAETEQLTTDKIADKSSSEDSEEENRTVQHEHQKTISSSDSEDETNAETTEHVTKQLTTEKFAESSSEDSEEENRTVEQQKTISSSDSENETYAEATENVPEQLITEKIADKSSSEDSEEENRTVEQQPVSSSESENENNEENVPVAATEDTLSKIDNVQLIKIAVYDSDDDFRNSEPQKHEVIEDISDDSSDSEDESQVKLKEQEKHAESSSEESDNEIQSTEIKQQTSSSDSEDEAQTKADSIQQSTEDDNQIQTNVDVSVITNEHLIIKTEPEIPVKLLKIRVSESETDFIDFEAEKPVLELEQDENLIEIDVKKDGSSSSSDSEDDLDHKNKNIESSSEDSDNENATMDKIISNSSDLEDSNNTKDVSAAENKEILSKDDVTNLEIPVQLVQIKVRDSDEDFSDSEAEKTKDKVDNENLTVTRDRRRGTSSSPSDSDEEQVTNLSAKADLIDLEAKIDDSDVIVEVNVEKEESDSSSSESEDEITHSKLQKQDVDDGISETNEQNPTFITTELEKSDDDDSESEKEFDINLDFSSDSDTKDNDNLISFSLDDVSSDSDDENLVKSDDDSGNEALENVKIEQDDILNMFDSKTDDASSDTDSSDTEVEEISPKIRHETSSSDDEDETKEAKNNEKRVTIKSPVEVIEFFTEDDAKQAQHLDVEVMVTTEEADTSDSEDNEIENKRITFHKDEVVVVEGDDSSDEENRIEATSSFATQMTAFNRKQTRRASSTQFIRYNQIVSSDEDVDGVQLSSTSQQILATQSRKIVTSQFRQINESKSVTYKTYSTSSSSTSTHSMDANK